MEKKRLINICIRLFIWSTISFCFLLLFSYSTSPVYSISWGHDSAVFQIIGKGWLDGYIPYRDLFDHKGPLLFLINAVGYMVGGKNGLFVLQCCFMTAFLEVSYQTCVLFLGRKISMSIPLIMEVILCRTFDEGNMTEEWSLLFIVVSSYFILKWVKEFDEGKREHIPTAAFIYGICFSFILFLRVTNAILVCCGVFVIACFLVKEKRWKNLLYNIIALSAGVLLGILPFSIYFAAKGDLYEMWYATVLFNLSYGIESIWDMKMKISLLLWAMGGLSIVYWYYRKRSPASYMGILSAVLTGVLLYHSRGYEHYYRILCTYVPLYVYMLSELWKEKKRFMAAIFIVGLLGQMGVTFIFLPQKVNREERLYINEALNQSFSSIMEQIPQNEKNSVVFYNMEAQAYLYAGIHPCVKYFTHQDFHGSISSDTQKDVITQFASVRPKWIVVEIVGEDPDVENEEMKQFLLDNYELKGLEQNSNRNEEYGIYGYHQSKEGKSGR